MPVAPISYRSQGPLTFLATIREVLQAQRAAHAAGLQQGTDEPGPTAGQLPAVKP